ATRSSLGSANRKFISYLIVHHNRASETRSRPGRELTDEYFGKQPSEPRPDCGLKQALLLRKPGEFLSPDRFWASSPARANGWNPSAYAAFRQAWRRRKPECP